MKKTVSAFIFLLGLSASTWAADDSGFYLGLTVGSDKISVDGLEDASGAGLLAGWKFNKNIALEFVGNASDSKADGLLAGCVFEIDTMALYLVGRTEGKFYGKGRIGGLSETITPRDTCVFVDKVSESGLSIGAGGGVHLGNNAAIELEYTLVEADVNRISMSVIYNF